MSTKEMLCSTGTLVREVNGRLNIPKKVNLWTLTQYFGEKKLSIIENKNTILAIYEPYNENKFKPQKVLI